jgi:manganese efflux pump family protein
LSWLEILAVSFGLAMDAFAVSIATGLSQSPVTFRQALRLSVCFGFFQFMMPILGWEAGKELAVLISFYDHWVAFALLLIVGGKMIIEASEEGKMESRTDPTHGWTLLVLSVATSIDAFAVGLSIAFLGISVWAPSVVIGVVTAVLSVLGVSYASRFGQRFGKWAEIGGGVVLIFIGVQIVISHLG